MRKSGLVLVGLGLLSVASGLWGQGVPAAVKAAEGSIDGERIRAHVKFLSDDLLDGRGPGLRGAEIAAQYIATQFALDGLKPGGDDGTYLQQINFVGMKAIADKTTMSLDPKQGAAIQLKYADDYTVSNRTLTPSVDVDAPIVFVGYGVTAPEFGWDDYAGADVKGKILLMLVNEPPSDDPKFFGGKALTYYGRWTYKYEQAASMGAAGVLLIHKTDMASYGWQVVRSSWSGERSSLADDRDPKLPLAAWVQLETARTMLADAGEDLDALIRAAQTKGFHARPLPLQVSAHVVSKIRPFESSNVIGKISGSSPELSKQAVIFTAHYDHLGIHPEQPGDNIYNGALDNATGTAMVMEIARAMAASPAKPKRSAYFALVTAEEQGLWGSEYLAQHPPVPVSAISLNLNFDAIKPLGIPTQVEAPGYERTDFAKVFEKTAADFKLAVIAPEHPENGGYYRSDHFSFAKVGVPAFSIGPGEHFTGHPVAWVKANSDAMEASYHQPSDEYKDEYDYRCNKVLSRFGIALAYRAGDQPALVQWRPGDEFEKAAKASGR